MVRTTTRHVEPAEHRDAGESGAAVIRADRVVEQVDRHDGQDLFGLARRSGLSDAGAEDAVQEALLRLWLEVRSGVDVIDPRAWMFRTVYRLAMDDHRLRRRAADLVARLGVRRRWVSEPERGDDASIWTHVDDLPTRQRQVLYLRYKADMTFEQIAGVIGISASAARAHASFAAGRLRIALASGWED
jgi:RNA polymerase sigma-70 factor (ECF subfamily)